MSDERTPEDYEIHVTVRGARPNDVADWALSNIEGDPDGRFIYTRHMPTLWLAKAAMNGLTNGLKVAGYVVSRQKIEHVVLDERFPNGH